MNTKLLEKIGLTVSVVVLLVAAWFWVGQIIDVRDMLEMAYG
jgi:hypothetical protein